MTDSPVETRMSPPRSLDEVRRNAERAMTRRLNPNYAESSYGLRMIRNAGDEAVKRELERRGR